MSYESLYDDFRPNLSSNKHHDTVFHGIGENFLIMESILKNGLVSDAASREIEDYYSNTNSNAKINSMDGISVAYDIYSGAYNTYIKNGGISFMIEDVYGEVNREGSFPGESIVKGSISPNKIAGLVINQEILNKKIEDFTFINSSEASDQWVNKSKHIKAMIERRIGGDIEDEKFDELVSSLETVQNDSSIDFFESMNIEKQLLREINGLLGVYASSMFTVENNIEDPTMLDVINTYNTDKLPIYDTDLNPISISYENGDEEIDFEDTLE